MSASTRSRKRLAELCALGTIRDRPPRLGGAAGRSYLTSELDQRADDASQLAEVAAWAAASTERGLAREVASNLRANLDVSTRMPVQAHRHLGVVGVEPRADALSVLEPLASDVEVHLRDPVVLKLREDAVKPGRSPQRRVCHPPHVRLHHLRQPIHPVLLNA